MKEQIRLLAERNRMAKTKEEKEAVAKEMETLKKQDYMLWNSEDSKNSYKVVL